MNSNVENKLDKFFFQFNKIVFPKGSSIIRSSHSITEIFYLKKGYVRQNFINSEGDEITLNIFEPGAYFPMMLILSEAENKYNFEAIDDVLVYRAPYEDILDFVKANPDVLFDLATRFSDGLCKILLKIENSYYKDAYYKVISLILYLSEKFGEKVDNGIKINLSLTHSDIASWVGISRETVSRQIEKLMTNNFIYYDEHFIIINNIKKLNSEIS